MKAPSTRGRVPLDRKIRIAFGMEPGMTPRTLDLNELVVLLADGNMGDGAAAGAWLAPWFAKKREKLEAARRATWAAMKFTLTMSDGNAAPITLTGPEAEKYGASMDECVPRPTPPRMGWLDYYAWTRRASPAVPSPAWAVAMGGSELLRAQEGLARELMLSGMAKAAACREVAKHFAAHYGYRVKPETLRKRLDRKGD
jgi:hypothetical protein